MKKWISVLLSLCMVLAMAGCAGGAGASQPSSAQEETFEAQQAVQTEAPAPAEAPAETPGPEQTEPEFRIAGLKGPTTMGMVKLMKDGEEGKTAHKYQVEMFGTPDEIVPLLKKGELDMAAVPANLAANLYQKLEGQVQAAAINTLGVLYVVSTGQDIHSIQDLAGRTVYSTGKGTTPEYVMNYLLEKNGLDPSKDLTLEYKSEATEVLATLKNAEKGAVAVLPQPYVTAAQMQVEGLEPVLDLTEEWNKVSPDSALVTGVLLVRKEVAEQKKEAFESFLSEYKNSIEWVNANVPEAAQLVAEYGIVAKAPIAEKALPACNITCIAGGEMKEKLSGYLAALFEQEPKAVGGKLPADDFYYGA